MVRYELRKKLGLGALAILAAVGATAAHAATQTVTANIAFDTPLSISGTPTMSLGTVRAGTVETYVLSTAGLLTAGTASNILYGTPSAASLTITGSTTQAINISAGNYTPNGGVTPSAATCKYGSGSAAACNSLTAQTAPGAATTLLVGVSAAADNTTIAGGTAAPTFDITVTYN